MSILYCICGNGNCYAAIVKDIGSCSKLNSAFSNVAANQEYIFNIRKNISVSADDSNARKLNKAGAVVTIVASGGNRTVTSANMGQGCIHGWFRWENIAMAENRSCFVTGHVPLLAGVGTANRIWGKGEASPAGSFAGRG